MIFLHNLTDTTYPYSGTVGRGRWYSTVPRRTPRKGGLREYANPPYSLSASKSAILRNGEIDSR
jgi:hypothetical protein